MKSHHSGSILLALLGISVLAFSHLALATYPYTINKAAIVYGLDWSDSDISYAAEHFDLVDMDFNGSRTDFFLDYYRAASLIKGNHSDIKILGYKDAVYMNVNYSDWATVAANPTWFMRTEESDTEVAYYNASTTSTRTILEVHPSASASRSAVSQSFPGATARLSKISFMLARSGSPNAQIKAALYSHTGTYGSGSKPDTLLAESTTSINANTLTTSAAWYDFDFDETCQMQSGTNYVAVVYCASKTTLDASNYIAVSQLTSGAHSGNDAYYASSAWSPGTRDTVFHIYGVTGGDYIYSSYWGCYLTDPSATGWQQHYADYVNTKLAQGTGNVYDGVFVDDVWNNLTAYTSGFNGTVSAAKQASWHEDMETFLTHIQTDITGTVLVNSDEFTTDDYLTITDGQMLEGYIHAPWDNSTTWDSAHLNLGAAHLRKSETGKIIFCSSGVSDYNEPILEMCYNNFVANSTDLEHSYFAFNGYASSDPHDEYYPIMDTLLEGAPTPTPTPTPTPGPTATPTPTASPTQAPSIAPTLRPAFQVDSSFSNLLTQAFFLVVLALVVVVPVIFYQFTRSKFGGRK